MFARRICFVFILFGKLVDHLFRFDIAAGNLMVSSVVEPLLFMIYAVDDREIMHMIQINLFMNVPPDEKSGGI